MAISNSVLDKYKTKELAVLEVKDKIVSTIKEFSDVTICPKDIILKEVTALIQVSSVKKSIIIEKKAVIEQELKSKNCAVILLG